MMNQCGLWKQVLKFSKPPRTLYYFLILVILLEIVYSQVYLHFVSPIVLFQQYLSQNTYQSFQKVQEFLNGELYIIIDDQIGWKNHPNYTFQNIHYDQYGSRSYHGINNTLPQQKNRIIFLGDSRINGGQWVSNHETINAYLEGPEIETLNFASFDYSLDQSYLLMESLQQQFQPNTIVIGIDSNPGRMLDTHFLPFYDLSMLPRLKPRIIYEQQNLVAVVPNYKSLLYQFPHNMDLLTYLKEHDPLYSHFHSYNLNTIWKQTPLLKIFSRNYVSFNPSQKNHFNQVENPHQVDQLFQAFQTFANDNQLTVIFIVFASRNEIMQPTQSYQTTINKLQAFDFLYVDTQKLFQQFPGESLELYADEIHCSATGNKIIADVLRLILDTKN